MIARQLERGNAYQSLRFTRWIVAVVLINEMGLKMYIDQNKAAPTIATTLTEKTTPNHINLHCNNAKTVFALIGISKRMKKKRRSKSGAKMHWHKNTNERFVWMSWSVATNATHSNCLPQNYAIPIIMMINQSYYCQIDFLLSTFSLGRELMHVCVCVSAHFEKTSALQHLNWCH